MTVLGMFIHIDSLLRLSRGQGALVAPCMRRWSRIASILHPHHLFIPPLQTRLCTLPFLTYAFIISTLILILNPISHIPIRIPQYRRLIDG